MTKSYILSQDEIENAIKLRLEGFSLGQIAFRFKISKQTILHHIKKRNCELLKLKKTKQEARILFRDDYSCKICKRTGFNISTLGSTRPNKGARVLCNHCLSNIETLVEMGYLKKC